VRVLDRDEAIKRSARLKRAMVKTERVVVVVVVVVVIVWSLI
jgi:hypothetical protein